MNIHYIDGKFAPASQAALPVSDLAILRGYGVFDFLRTYGGKPFQLRAHLQRLLRSATMLDLPCAWDIEELRDIVTETLSRNSHEESGIRILLTGGDSPNGFMPAGKSRLMVLVAPASETPARYYEQGAEVATINMRRDTPQAKTINYIPGITAQKYALARNPKAIEAIYRDNGNILEGARSNTFIRKDGLWITPADDVLLGITRALVIKMLNAQGRLQLRKVSLAEYHDADEVILTSTTKEIMPVVKVDQAIIGNGQPGQHSRRLMREWREMTNRFAATGECL